MSTPPQAPSTRELLAQPGLSPLLPMLYVAWVDGTLSAQELAQVQALALTQSWLEPPAREVLA